MIVFVPNPLLKKVWLGWGRVGYKVVVRVFVPNPLLEEVL